MERGNNKKGGNHQANEVSRAESFRGWSFRDLLASRRKSMEEFELEAEENSKRSRNGKAVKGSNRMGPTDEHEVPKPQSENPQAEFTSSWSLRELLGSRRASVDESEVGSEMTTPKRKKLRGVGGGVKEAGMASGSSSPQLGASPIRETIINPAKILLTPSATFARIKEEKEEISRQTPSPKEWTLKYGITLPLIGDVKWEELKEHTKVWLRNPKNLALLVWVIAVAVAGAILFMVMVGMLNAVIPKKSNRDTWFEVSNQILNALFTLMVLYVHPTRILHTVWLIRWQPKDIIKLRQVYCKGGLRKPNEWVHMLVVVLLLQLNCFAQYALCGLNWGYRRANRPAFGVGITLATSFGAAAAAGIYNSVSPLGKDFEEHIENDEVQQKVNLEDDEIEADKIERGESKVQPSIFHLRHNYKLLEKRLSFASKEGRFVEHPEWEGGLFDCYEEPTITLFSAACLPCVLGWNLDRMGFGNRYVHVVTFLLLCAAPFLVFDLAAINVNNGYVRHSLGATGIVLCVFGLLYGGFWRIRMRERYNLPPKKWCCGQPGMTDCTQWLFCSFCSLCQEVRTAEAYDIKDDKFYTKRRVHTPGNSPPRLVPNGGDGIDMMTMPGAVPSSSSIQPLPISSMVPIQDSELVVPIELIPADETVFSPPPPQNVNSHKILELESSAEQGN